MLSDEIVNQFRDALQTCNTARGDLETALESVTEEKGDDESYLRSVAAALESWRKGQRQFMEVLEDASVSDVSTVAMLLKMNHGIDASNARCGLPGVPTEGADQPFPLEVSGLQGTVLTEAAMKYVSSSDEN